MNLTCTITRAGMFDEYGRPLTVSQSYTGSYYFVKDLVRSGYASVLDQCVFDDDSTPMCSEVAVIPDGSQAVSSVVNQVTGGLEYYLGDGIARAPDGSKKVGLEVTGQAIMAVLDQMSDGKYLCTSGADGNFGRRLFLYTGEPTVGGGVATALTNTSVMAANALKNTAGVVIGNDGNGVTNAWAASNGDVFFTAIDNNGLAYLFRAKAGTYTVGSDAGYSNKQACVDIGLNGGVQTAGIRILTKRSFLEAKVGNAKHYFLCEYNVATGRTNGSGGAGKDQAIVYRSTDGGTTWAVFLEFNTGGSHVVDHFHGAVQDPYTGWIYFMTGDSGAECAIIGYNGTAAAPAANTALATIGTTAGYKVINGSELNRYCDLGFTETSIISIPDADKETNDTGSIAYVSTLLPKTLDYVSSLGAVARVNDIPPVLILQGDGFYAALSFRANIASESYLHVWTSDSINGNWTLILKVKNYKSDSTGVPSSFFSDRDGNIWIGGLYGQSVQLTSAVQSGSSLKLSVVGRGKSLPVIYDGA